MRVLFLTHYYPPEIGAPQTRISELAARLVAKRHDVRVLTGMPHYPDGVVPRAYRGRLFMREAMDGVPVVRTWVYAARNAGFVRRLLDHASFTITCLFGAPLVGRCQVVVTECPPLFTALAGLLMSRVWGAKHLFHVADLWPESAVALGGLRNPILVRAATALARFLYDRSDRITVSAKGQKERLTAYGLREDKIVHIPNGVDVDRFRPGAGDPAFRKRHGLTNKFVALYHGTHGVSHGLGTVLDAAALLARRPDATDIVFVLMGDGAERAMLVERASREGLANVVFAESVPHEQVPAVLNEIDLGLVHLRRLPLFDAVQPSKMFEFMACGRPLVLAVGGEARDIVLAAGCGTCVHPESPAELANAVVALRDDRNRRAEMGAAGRRFVERGYTRANLTDQWERTLLAVVGEHRAG